MITDPQRLEALKQKLRRTQSMIDMMKKSCTPEELERLRKQWIEPIEKEIETLQDFK